MTARRRRDVERGTVLDGRWIIMRDGSIMACSDGAVPGPWNFERPSAKALAHPGIRLFRDGIRRLSRSMLRTLRSRAFSGSVAVLPLMIGATAARGQALQPLVTPALDPEYNRGRNVSVTEETEPSLQQLGVRFGSVLAYPSLGITSGATDNVYVNNSFKRSDAFYVIQPAVRVTTDWAMHQLNLVASADVQRFAHETLRNQEAFFVSGESRLDLGPDLQVAGKVQYSRASETPFATDVSSDISVLSQFSRFNPSLTAVYKGGRMRLTARVDAQKLNFDTIRFADGSSRDQRERDRRTERAALQAEYAVSPSIATFVQGTFEKTTFLYPRLDGQPSRSSDGYTALVGVNFDLAGMMRGSVAVGYTSRDYTAAAYETVGGLALQVQAEFFPTPLTTVGIGAQRVIQDANSPYNAAYSDTRASVTVDHALLRNLILTANFLGARQKILDTSANRRLLRGTFAARYQTSRSINIGGSLEYSKARTGALPLGVPFNEFRGQVTLRLRR
jgi:hypothetical protein